MLSIAVWSSHEQGRAVAKEPLVRDVADGGRGALELSPDPAFPLQGVRVLDLARG